MTHPHQEALRKSDEAFANGDVEGALAIYHDDCVFHVPGRHSFAGNYTGKEALLEIMGPFRQRYSPTGSETLAIFADDEHGIILERWRATRGDRAYEERLVSVARFRDGKVSEIWFIPFDQYARDEWMA